MCISYTQYNTLDRSFLSDSFTDEKKMGMGKINFNIKKKMTHLLNRCKISKTKFY